MSEMEPGSWSARNEVWQRAVELAQEDAGGHLGRHLQAGPQDSVALGARAADAGDPGAGRGAGDRGRGGGSARSFARAQQERYRARVRERWGVLAPVLLLFVPVDGGVRAAQKGAAGEERLAGLLDRWSARSRGRVVVLHDRRLPGRRENFDHVVVTSGGVWAVDAKAYAGLLSVRGAAGHARLFAGDRQLDRLVAQALRQRAALERLVGDVGGAQVQAALCFVGGRWAAGTDGRSVHGVQVLSERRLRAALWRRGHWSTAQIAQVASALDARLAPADLPG